MSEKTKILQMTLDLPELQQYFHENEPNRKPLHISGNANVIKDSLLQKFDEAVVWTEKTEAGEIPYFEFTDVEIEAKTASVDFAYPVEGIKGTVKFKKTGDEWQIDSQTLKES